MLTLTLEEPWAVVGSLAEREVFREILKLKMKLCNHLDF
jgi:hypothetical protein